MLNDGRVQGSFERLARLRAAASGLHAVDAGALQSTLNQFEDGPKFSPHDSHVQELRRRLLLAIGDLEVQRNRRAKCA